MAHTQVAPPTLAIADEMHEETVCERVHPQTLALITTLSTKNFNALQFIAHLLRLASAKQHALGNPTDCVIISVQSVQELSARLDWPWGYTTTHKVIRVLEALELLQRTHGELHLVCGAPRLHPHILANLQKLQESKTPKVRQLATRVRKQLEAKLLHRQEMQGQFPLLSNSPVAQAAQKLASALQHQGIAITPQLAGVLYVTCQELAGQLLPPSSSTEKALSLKDETWFSFDGITQGNPGAGNKSEAKGNSPRLQEDRGTSKGNFAGTEGISPVTYRSESDSAPVLPSLHSEPEFPSRGQLLAQEEPFVETQRARQDAAEFPFFLPNPPLEDQNSPFNGNEGNSASSLTLNVNTIYSQESSNNGNVSGEPDARHLVLPSYKTALARLFANAVEGHQKNVANYVTYLSRFEYRTILATYLYVAQQRQLTRSRMKSPGRYFDTMVKVWGGLGTYDQACACYDRARDEGMVMRLPGIPWDIRRLVARFEVWPLEDVVVEIRLHPESALFAVADPVDNGEVAENSEEEGFERGDDLEVGGAEPRVPQQWMSLKEASALLQDVQLQAAEIATRREGALIEVAATPRPYRVRGTRDVVFVVDVTIERMPVAFASAEQWRLYYLEQTDLTAYKSLCQQLGDAYGF